jgi:hypothetical protein
MLRVLAQTHPLSRFSDRIMSHLARLALLPEVDAGARLADHAA